MDPEDDFEVLPDLTPEQIEELHMKQLAHLRTFYSSSEPYQIENWYLHLAGFTPPSYSFVLTAAEAYFLQLIYYDDTLQFDPYFAGTKQTLISKVNEFISLHFPDGCFFKLSTRSPKDYGWNYSAAEVEQAAVKLEKYILSRVSPAELEKEQLSALAANSFYAFFLQESKHKLLIMNGEQFIEVFAHSERIMIDLHDLSCLKGIFKQLKEGRRERGQEELVQVWGRQWREVAWSQQFRCFYHDYTLTAISQYDQRCFFPQVAIRKELIRQNIIDFFSQILKGLREAGLKDGVMDVMVQEKVELIQINVFNENTRAGLFKWKEDEGVLKKGDAQIRVVEKYGAIRKDSIERMMGMLGKGVELVVKRACDLLGLSRQWREYEGCEY